MPETSVKPGHERRLRKELAQLRTVIAVSPHFDDGVFSCGGFLARHPGSTLLTVFATAPLDAALQTEWDRRCGFNSAGEAVAARRDEDRSAAAVLGLNVAWLPFVDAQYAAPPRCESIEDALLGQLCTVDSDAMLMPLGLFHSDHVLVSNACLRLLKGGHASHCVAYEDALYRQKAGLVQQRLIALQREGIIATPVVLGGSASDARKRLAVGCYRSQLQAFGDSGHSDVYVPERYWLLELREAVGA